MTKEITIPRDDAEVQEFTHPNGETGILIGLTLTEERLADLYDLESPAGDSPLVMPLKHKADGATNFENYRTEDDTLVIVHTDEQYETVKNRLEMML